MSVFLSGTRCSRNQGAGDEAMLQCLSAEEKSLKRTPISTGQGISRDVWGL